MNREILFRGKGNPKYNDGDWYYGYLIFDGEDYQIVEPKYGSFRRTVLKETVGEFTGMTDKNDKKIFEGDILEFSDRIVSVFWHAHLGCWDSDFIKFTNKENDREDMSLCRWSYSAKVVGNIHDNPELLKDGKK